MYFWNHFGSFRFAITNSLLLWRIPKPHGISHVMFAIAPSGQWNFQSLVIIASIHQKSSKKPAIKNIKSLLKFILFVLKITNNTQINNIIPGHRIRADCEVNTLYCLQTSPPLGYNAPFEHIGNLYIKQIILFSLFIDW